MKPTVNAMKRLMSVAAALCLQDAVRSSVAASEALNAQALDAARAARVAAERSASLDAQAARATTTARAAIRALAEVDPVAARAVLDDARVGMPVHHD